MNKLLILGAGGHGKVVAEAAELEGRWKEIAFLDDREELKEVMGFQVIGKMNDYSKLIHDYKYAFVAIGNNEKRIELINELEKAGFNIPTIIHPKACVSKYSTIDKGTVVLPGAVVNTSTKIGKGCIININVVVDHDCEIDHGVHISSGAVVRSMVKIGKLSSIGAGACVKSGTKLKERFELLEGKTVEGDENIGK